MSFNGTDGAHPHGSLIIDAEGDLFGTTSDGGVGLGTVFAIAKTASGYASAPTTLVTFHGTDGAHPVGSLTVDANGDLFGTTAAGGAHGLGTVFEVFHTAFGYVNPTTLVSFDGTNGSLPVGSLTMDAHGNLFGTTFFGGANNLGTVFQITGNFFV